MGLFPSPSSSPNPTASSGPSKECENQHYSMIVLKLVGFWFSDNAGCLVGWVSYYRMLVFPLAHVPTYTHTHTNIKMCMLVNFGDGTKWLARRNRENLNEKARARLLPLINFAEINLIFAVLLKLESRLSRGDWKCVRASESFPGKRLISHMCESTFSRFCLIVLFVNVLAVVRVAVGGLGGPSGGPHVFV